MELNLSDERLETLYNALKEYRYYKPINEAALKKLNSILNELKFFYFSNNGAIAYENSRIKEENSYLNKINNRLDKGMNVNYQNMHDIVGTRLVCLSITDVYNVVNLIKKSNIKILREKNYIEKPKQSGYRGYHLSVEIPVENGKEISYVTCEIQLRTIFMDIFAREEHKLSYKGNASNEDKLELKKLSDKLYFYDCAIDNLFKIENQSKDDIIEDSDLILCKQEFDKISYLYDVVYEKINEKINNFVSEYPNKDDILHINSRIKETSSINRKLKRKSLSCSAQNILYNIRDVVGFKLVCIDINVAKDFIKYFVERIGQIEKIEITNESDRLDNAKESGYRGYKMNMTVKMPSITGPQPITIEVLIRTMVMDAWALHDDKIFNNDEASKKMKMQLKGLSDALSDVEKSLLDIKTNQTNNNSQPDLVSAVIEYKNRTDEPDTPPRNGQCLKLENDGK